MIGDEEQIKAYIRQMYGDRARSVADLTVIDAETASCCSGQCTSTKTSQRIYTRAEMEGLPMEVLAASAGCGNPTALAELQPSERVLDLGSGGGIDCFLAARQVGPEGHVTGLEMTPDVIDLARRNGANLGLTNVEFIQGEMENIPLPDSCVDVVISNCVIVLSMGKDAVFREAYRVLTPGGRIHISDMMAVGELPDGIREDPEKWASCMGGAEERDVYLGRLTKAGFVGISILEERPYDEASDARKVFSVKVVAHKPAA